MINKKVLNEALRVAGGLYSFNEPNAKGYAFDINTKGNDIAEGMFIGVGRWYQKVKNDYEFYIDFSTKTIKNNETGETKELKQ